MGAVVIAGPLSYANITDGPSESRDGHGGNECNNPKFVHDCGTVDEDDTGHDHDDLLSIETISSQSVDLPSAFPKRQGHEQQQRPAKKSPERLSLDDDRGDDDDDASNPSFRSLSLPPSELSLRLSQVTVNSELEIGSTRWEGDVNSGTGVDFGAGALEQSDYSIANNLGLYRLGHVKDSFPNISNSGSIKHSPIDPPCDPHDSKNHQDSKGQGASVLMNEATTHNFEDEKNGRVAYKEEHYHSLQTLEMIGSRMQDGEVLAMQKDSNAIGTVHAAATSKGISPVFMLKMVGVLFLIFFAGRIVLHDQRFDAVAIFNMKMVDFDTSFEMEAKGITATSNRTIVKVPTVVEAPVPVVELHGTHCDEGSAFANRASVMSLADLVTNPATTPVLFIPSMPEVDQQNAAFYPTEFLFMVALVFVIVKITASSPSHPRPDVCGSQDKEGMDASGTRYHPQDSPLECESTARIIPLNKHENDLNLQAYESMKVVELRRLLRTRKCNTEGTKEVLIGRLIAVYQAELATLTVQQLRRKLRSNGCLQSGKKVELIGRLVEAGL